MTIKKKAAQEQFNDLQQIQKERKKYIALNLSGQHQQKPDTNREGHCAPTTFDSIEEAKILAWEVKSKNDSVPFVFKKNKEESSEDITQIDADFTDKNLTMRDQTKLALANLCAATGTGGGHAGTSTLLATIGAIHKNETGDHASTIQATQEALIAMKPNDIFEGMLNSKLWVLHNHYMKYMAYASHPDTQQQAQEMYTNRAIKLMRLHNETLEALNKHRRKGEQKVVVVHQNVQVNDGGQALVTGELSPGAGSEVKKSKE